MATEEKRQAPPRGRRGWIIALLVLVGVVVLGAAWLVWAASERRHEAATYGITDPSSAALRIENRTTDFAIGRVTIEDPAEMVTVLDVPSEISMGAETVLEIAPGTYRVSVFYVETAQAVMGRPSDTLDASFTISPGEAVILCLEGGRSSPDGMIFVPPELVLK